MERATTPQDVVDALATLAPELGCRHIRLEHPSHPASWASPACGKPDPVQKPENVWRIDLPDGISAQFTLASGISLGNEQRLILEELLQLLPTSAGSGLDRQH